ncbi:MAG: patatin-like phospholipase family protein [Planctomycetota bacterium]|jgi:NTE family protein|nr:patatin-like phospholipase family protein [Planctomycetota bacterium]
MEGNGFGMALGGGGVRAFAHFGVLSGLAEAGLRPGFISGSSMGAVLGALYAGREGDLGKIISYFRQSPLFGRAAKPPKGDGLRKRFGRLGGLTRKMAAAGIASIISFRQGLRRSNPVNQAIDDFFGAGRNFENLAIPFGANAVDLSAGSIAEFTSGPLAPALKAGVAVGLVFAPFAWNGGQYADAAPLCPAPVGLCRRLGAARVLAVDISAPLERDCVCQNGFDVVRRLMSLQSDRLNAIETANADLVLRLDLSDIFWGDFSRIDEAMERGWRGVKAALGTIREKLCPT